MDALVTASFLLVGWNTYSAIIVAKDTYTGKMPGPKSIGYSIAGLAGLTAFMLYTYGIAAEKHPELLEAEGFYRCSDCDSPINEEEVIGDGTNRGECCACWACYDDLAVCNDKRDCERWEDEWDAEDRDEEERMSRSEAEDLAEKIEKMVEPYVDRVEVCGSYRRGSPTPGDLDVIIIPKKGITLPMIIEDIKPAQVNWLGEKKTQIVVDGHKIDFRVSSPKGWGAALLYFTGPAGYNIGMRLRAKRMGMKLNEYGLFDRSTDAYLGGETEDDIYQLLGKTPRHPRWRSKRAEQTFRNKCSNCGVIGETFTVNTTRGSEKHFCGPVCYNKYEGLASESENPYAWLTEGECAMCGNESKFVVEDLAVGPRAFCCEACYAQYVGLPVKEEGYYGLAAESKTYDPKHYNDLVAGKVNSEIKESMREEGWPEHEINLMYAIPHASYAGFIPEVQARELFDDIHKFNDPANQKQYESETQTFEAPRATYTNPAQQSFEKSYHIRAKKPLNKIVKDSLGGNLPSDDSRGYYYRSGTTLNNLSPEDFKTIQGYLAVQNMAASRFQTTNRNWAGIDYPNINDTNAIEKSIQKTNYLSGAVKHYHALAGLSDDDIIEYISENMVDRDFEGMLSFIRYYDMMETGPYKGIKMVATDRAPYETGGGYGNVYYNSRNPYDTGGTNPANFGTYDKTAQTLTLPNTGQGAVFTRLTKLRPYTELLPLSKDSDAYIEYTTDGGFQSYKGSGQQSFRLTPFVCPETNRDDQRNPDPGYSSRQTKEGWRYDIKDWEEVKSAAYRYATIVYLPSQKELQAAHGSGRELPRQTIVAILNKAAKAAKKAKQEEEERKEEQSYNLARKNKAIDSLQNATKSMQETLKVLVRQAKNAGVDEDDIYDALEHTLYDIEEMIEDWEPSDYWDAEGKKSYGCKKCGTGPHKATIVEDKVFILCPVCGLVGGSEDATAWDVTWTKDTPHVLAKRPFADVEWETNSEE